MARVSAVNEVAIRVALYGRGAPERRLKGARDDHRDSAIGGQCWPRKQPA